MMQGMVIKNMSFKVGQTLTVAGVAKPDAENFEVNIGPSEDAIALHINPRFNAHGDTNTIVCNSFEGGNWCQEQREDCFPFFQGEEFKIVIEFTPSEFVVTLPNDSTFHFPNRIGAEKYSVLSFNGDARIRSVEINFAVNIGPSEDRTAFHFNSRFNDLGDINTIVCNSFEAGNWCQEQREKCFPFYQGEEFKIVIKFTLPEFVVTLPGDTMFCFPNRIGVEKYSVLSFDGDARIRSIEIN